MSIERLKQLAREAEISVVEHPESNGHFTVVGEVATVNWWPTSKNQTAWVEGQRSRKFVTAEQVIRWAQTGSPFQRGSR
jgi:predicted NUDIX family NTP pyrophosphohydrolase